MAFKYKIHEICNKKPPLIIAIENESIDIVDFLLKQPGININEINITFLVLIKW